MQAQSTQNQATLGSITPAPQMALTDFIDEFGQDLMQALNRSNPPVYSGCCSDVHDRRQQVMDGLKRPPFAAQAEAVQTVCALLADQREPAAIINAEMGTGKTMMAIATAAVLHKEGAKRFLVIAPPHLVYKWRREILETVENAKVWVLNGADTLGKLLQLRDRLGIATDLKVPEFFILGRIRMRMGFHWRAAYQRRITRNRDTTGERICHVVCPDCGAVLKDSEGNPLPERFFTELGKRCACPHCGSALWTLMHNRSGAAQDRQKILVKSLCQLPAIGPVKAKRLLELFGEDFLASMLSDNVHEFIHLMDEHGRFIFSDAQAKRMERAMSHLEFGFGGGSYQPTEFIKRQLPDGFFDLLIVDEGHEYKNAGSAQGQAMGVLAAKTKQALLLTGTLMGGYADDLFFLLFRVLTRRMLEDGYKPNQRGSLAGAAMTFMREHGVLKDIYTERSGGSHRTARGKQLSVRSAKAPGFGPMGILRYILPFTVFLKLRELGHNAPDYAEEFRHVEMTAHQLEAYKAMEATLTTMLRRALAVRDTSLLGVVLNVLLAWPDCAFRPEVVKHPRTRDTLVMLPALFGEQDLMPKEQALLDICLAEHAKGRKVLVYSVYTGTRDTTARLKRILQQAGLKTAVLSASVDTGKREDWIMEQVERGIDVLITNPDLVKTGLDLLDFPTIVFMQSGFNVYTLQQAARRSWRIGQTQAVRVIFLGYEKSAQLTCLALMAKKIAVAQSTAGDIPQSGLDALNTDGDSVEMALARQLVIENPQE